MCLRARRRTVDHTEPAYAGFRVCDREEAGINQHQSGAVRTARQDPPPELPISVERYGAHYWLVDANSRKLARVEGIGEAALDLARHLAMTYNVIAKARRGKRGPRSRS